MEKLRWWAVRWDMSCRASTTSLGSGLSSGSSIQQVNIIWARMSDIPGGLASLSPLVILVMTSLVFTPQYGVPPRVAASQMRTPRAQISALVPEFLFTVVSGEFHLVRSGISPA